MSLFRNEYVHLPGTARIDMSKSSAAQYLPKVPAFTVLHLSGLVAASPTAITLFNAPSDSATYGQYKVVSAVVSAGVAGGASAALDLVKAVDGVAIGSGTSILSATVNLNSITADTETAAALVTDNSNTLAAGSRLGVKLSGTLTGLANGSITVVLERV
jgi:hypothetical protein